MSSLFYAFRDDFNFTYYGSMRSAARHDIRLAAVMYACVLVFCAVLISSLGTRGKQRWLSFFRGLYGFLVSAAMLILLFCPWWKTGAINGQDVYNYWTGESFSGKLGLHVGLDSLNITMEGHVENGGTVYYNEQLSWFQWGRVQEEYSTMLRRGLPHSILVIADHFNKDVGGLRWGRTMRNAGYFTNMLLWTAFSFWSVALLLFQSILSYGVAMTLLSGVTVILAGIIYHVMQPAHAVNIQFDGGALTLSYAWCFWLCLAVGIMLTLTGLVLLLALKLSSCKVHCFFGLTPTDCREHVYSVLSRVNDNTVLGIGRSQNDSFSSSGYLNIAYSHDCLPGADEELDQSVLKSTDRNGGTDRRHLGLPSVFSSNPFSSTRTSRASSFTSISETNGKSQKVSAKAMKSKPCNTVMSTLHGDTDIQWMNTGTAVPMGGDSIGQSHDSETYDCEFESAIETTTSMCDNCEKLTVDVNVETPMESINHEWQSDNGCDLTKQMSYDF